MYIFLNPFRESQRKVLQDIFGDTDSNEEDVINPVLGVKMSKLAEKTRILTEQLRGAGYEVVEKWEHDFLKEKKSDQPLPEFLKDHDIQDRLNPRDSFYGGRTNAIKLFHEGPAKYIDFTSLYPWCNKYAQ